MAEPIWIVVVCTKKGHALHPQFSVHSIEFCEDPHDGMGPMPYVMFTEGLVREEADRICAELNRCRANPRAMVSPENLVPPEPVHG